MVPAPDNIITTLSLFVLSTNQKLFKLELWAILYINNLCSFEHGELEHNVIYNCFFFLHIKFLWINLWITVFFYLKINIINYIAAYNVFQFEITVLLWSHKKLKRFVFNICSMKRYKLQSKYTLQIIAFF